MVYLEITCAWRHLLTILGFKDLSIATTGMGSDLLHIAKVVRFAGETLLERCVGPQD